MLQTPAPENDHEHLIAIYNAVQAIQARILELCVQSDSQCRRLDHLESWQNRISGGLAVVGLVAGTALGKLLFGGP